MPTARYWRLTAVSKTVPSEVDISGIRFFKHDDLVSLVGATTRVNWSPVAGSLDILRRNDIVNGEVVTIPASTKGKSIVYDFQAAVEINAFQIGFGTNEERALNKFIIEWSKDGLSYTPMTKITNDLKLKFTAPFTFSSLSASNTGFPAVWDKSFYTNIPFASREHTGIFIDSFERRIFEKNNNGNWWNYQTYAGQDFFMPITNWLKPGKFYFEFTAETLNQRNHENCIYLGIGFKNTEEFPYANRKSILIALSQWWNGRAVEGVVEVRRETSLGSSSPPSFSLPPQGKLGYQAGISLDLLAGKFEHRNSPYIANFNYTVAESYFPTIADTDSIFFFLMTGAWQDALDLDLSFNFGQKPWVNSPPPGFDSRVGSRYELDKDTTFEKALLEATEERYTFPLVTESVPIYTPNFKTNKNNQVISVTQTHFIKGNISGADNVKKPRIVKLFTYPGMVQIASTKSRASDGLYEFLYLEDRDYAIVSQDQADPTYQSEIIAPIRSKVMVFNG